MLVRAAIAASLSLSLGAAPALAADGAQLFNLHCRGCHTGGPAGPGLGGVAGGPVAAKTGYAFSPSLKAKGGTWTDARLDAYLKAPAAFAPGTKMLIATPSGADRAAIIAYMKTLK